MHTYIFTFLVVELSKLIVVQSKPITAESENGAVIRLIIEDETLKRYDNAKFIFLKTEKK